LDPHPFCTIRIQGLEKHADPDPWLDFIVADPRLFLLNPDPTLQVIMDQDLTLQIVSDPDLDPSFVLQN